MQNATARAGAAPIARLRAFRARLAAWHGARNVPGMTRSPLVPALALSAVGALCPACFDTTPDYAFLDHDDVQIEPVRGAQYRAATEYGDIYAISMQSAHEVGGWIGVVVDGVGDVMKLLDRFPAGEVDADGFDVYGPYHPRDAGVSWLFRLAGDVEHTRFEVWVGPERADARTDMGLLLSGEVTLKGSRRRGAFNLDFDVFEAHGDALKIGPDRDRHYTGVVALEFERDLDSDFKHLDIDYDNFTVTQEIPIHEYFAATRYRFLREADGAGEFHVDIASTFQTLLWSGPEVEDMVIDMTWNSDGAGRAHGEMRERADEGDLMLGDLILDECFDERGALVWRQLSDSYADALPDYNTGDPRNCADVSVAISR